MKEYIERELLLIGVDGCISALHAKAKGDPIQEGAIKLVEATRDYIASLSAADVVEVVRCRDCKHACAVPFAPGRVSCWFIGQPTPTEGYCHRGQRKEDEHEAD